MKTPSSFHLKSRLVLAVSLLVLAFGVYFGRVQNLTNQDLLETEKTTGEVSDEGLVSSSTDLVDTYTKLYGKYQVKAFANHKFSMPTDTAIQLLRLEATTLDQLYFKMTAVERKKIKRVSFPFVQLEVAGKIRYKRFEDLSPAEKKLLNC